MAASASAAGRFPTGVMIVLAGLSLAAALLLAIVERIGLPASLLFGLALVLLAAAMLGPAFLGATMRPSRFYTAGREVGPFGGAIGGFSLLLCIAAVLGGGFMPGTLLMPKVVPPLMAGVLVLLPCALILAPAIRRSGAYTLVDFVRCRFGGRMPAVLALAAASIALAPVVLASAAIAIEGLVAVFDMTPASAQSVGLLLAATPFLIGGMMSGRISLVALGACIGLALLLPLAFASARLGRLPVSADDLSRLLNDARPLAALWQPASSEPVMLGIPAIPDLSGKAALIDLLGLTLGLGAVFLLCGLFTQMRTAARGASAAGMTAALIVMLPLVSIGITAGTVLALKASLVGTDIAALPTSFTNQSLAGLLRLCGTDPVTEALPLACEPGSAVRRTVPHLLQLGDVAIEPDLLGSHAAEALRMPVVTVLIYRLLPALLGLAALGLTGFALAATLAHDGLYRMLKPDAVASWRLAATRFLTLVTIAAGLDLAPQLGDELPMLLRAGLSLAAATLLPLALVALLPRAGGATALLTLLGGLVVFIVFVAQGPETATEAGVYGFIGALVMACAGLASCAPTKQESDFARALVRPDGPALILDRAT